MLCKSNNIIVIIKVNFFNDLMIIIFFKNSISIHLKRLIPPKLESERIESETLKEVYFKVVSQPLGQLQMGSQPS